MEPDLSQTSHEGDTHFPRAIPFSVFSSHLQACLEQLLLSCSRGAQKPPLGKRKVGAGEVVACPSTTSTMMTSHLSV